MTTCTSGVSDDGSSLATLTFDYDINFVGIRSLFFSVDPISDAGTNSAFAIDSLTVVKF